MYNISLAICNFFFGCFGFDCLCEYIKKYRPNQVRMYATMDAFMHAFMYNYMYICVWMHAGMHVCIPDMKAIGKFTDIHCSNPCSPIKSASSTSAHRVL